MIYLPALQDSSLKQSMGLWKSWTLLPRSSLQNKQNTMQHYCLYVVTLNSASSILYWFSHDLPRTRENYRHILMYPIVITITDNFLYLKNAGSTKTCHKFLKTWFQTKYFKTFLRSEYILSFHTKIILCYHTYFSLTSKTCKMQNENYFILAK